MVCSTTICFSCNLCPAGQMEDKGSHREVSLVFYSTFEPISLPRDSYMQSSGIPMLYEQAASQLPTLYVFPVVNVLGRVPLIPYYMMGTSRTRFLTPCGMKFYMAQPPTPGQTAEQAATFSRSTSGCGAMGGRSPERSRWRMPKRCGRLVFHSPGAGDLKS
jgi:hypothetical protein